jgi:hypothetical protein
VFIKSIRKRRSILICCSPWFDIVINLVDSWLQALLCVCNRRVNLSDWLLVASYIIYICIMDIKQEKERRIGCLTSPPTNGLSISVARTLHRLNCPRPIHLSRAKRLFRLMEVLHHILSYGSDTCALEKGCLKQRQPCLRDSHHTRYPGEGFHTFSLAELPSIFGGLPLFPLHLAIFQLE